MLHPTQMDHVELARDLLETEPLLAVKIEEAASLARGQGAEMLVEVLRFLHLVVWSGKTLTPPQILDLGWHEFILFTRLYATTCEKQFGRFIHHQPGGEEAENRSQLRNTLKLYQLCFDAPNPVYWGEQGYYGEAAGCGACEGVPAPEQGEHACTLQDR